MQGQRAGTHLTCIPDACVESRGASVQGVGAVVDGELVFLLVQGKGTFSDAVAVAADQGGEEGLGAVDDTLDIGVTLDDVGYVAVLVGHHDGHDGTAVIGDGHFISLSVSQYV